MPYKRIKRERKIHEFKGTVFCDPGIMEALRFKYGVKGLAELTGINKRGLYNQFELGRYRQSEDVRDKLVTLYERECK